MFTRTSRRNFQIHFKLGCNIFSLVGNLVCCCWSPMGDVYCQYEWNVRRKWRRGNTWRRPLCGASRRASPALTVLSCQMLTPPYQHCRDEKLCINQLIFEVYSLDSQRFKSFESTCLSSGRQKGKRLYLHCRF